MRTKQLAVAAMLAMGLAGCSSQQLVYPVFPAERAGPHATSFEHGWRLEKGHGATRDYGRAAAAYRAAGEAGDARAWNNLGMMALHGRGQAPNPSAARALFVRGAQGGSAAARFNLGMMYDTGYGARRDATAAAYEYRMAAEMGHAQAQHRLAQMLEGGQGVPASMREAERLYAMAAAGGRADALERLSVLKGSPMNVRPGPEAAALFAEEACDCSLSNERRMASRGQAQLAQMAAAGDAPARYNLAVRLLKGESAHQDPSEAARLFTLAARQGYAPAQRQLAHMHLRGQAVARSKALAHAWLNMAAAGTGEEARLARGEMEALELTMRAAEVAESQKLAAEWRR